MSDEPPPPPKPKPGSLRDRIAAFEKQNAAAPAPTPPPPRPKPGHVQWKPKQPSPPTSPGRSSTDAAAPPVERAKAGGMSAADAKESIGKGVSLKERMAALQGKGAFGAPAGPTSPPLPPKPAGEKPKWKPPPASIASPDEEVEAPAGEPVRVKSPPVEGGDAEPANAEGEEAQAAPEGEEAQGEPDPEEEERQRRAAIAARMARLGGAKIGMLPPTPAYGKKPPPPKKAEAPPPEAVSTAKSPEVPKVEQVSPLEGTGPEEPPMKSPSLDAPEPSMSKSSEEDGYFKRGDSASSAMLSPDSASATSVSSVRSPSSMPVPAGPKRAAPPRRKAAKSPSPAPQQVLDEPIKESPSETPALETPAPEVESKAEEPGDLKKAVEELPAETPGPVPVSEPEQHADVAPAESAQGEDLSALGASHPDAVTEDLPKEAQEAVEDEQAAKEQSGPLDEAAPEPEGVEPSHSHDEASPAGEEEEDEEARRKRVAERIAKMGGINPLAAPPPPTMSPPSLSERPEPTRKESIGFAASQPLPVSPQPTPGVERRQSSFSDALPSSPPQERRPSVESSGFGRRASASSRKSSIDVGMGPPPVPSSPRPQVPQRQASIGSVSGEGPPPVPTSPRPDASQRRSSVGSVKSVGGLARRQSEDDRIRREISVSSQPAVEEEDQEDLDTNEPEPVSHGHGTADAYAEAVQPQSPPAGVVGHDDQRLTASETQDELIDSPDDAEPMSATVPIPIPPPSTTRLPPTPNLSTRPVIAQEDFTVETPVETNTPRQESIRRSIPPPPRGPPAVPVEVPVERVLSPFPRRSVPPPPEEREEEEVADSEVPAVIRDDDHELPVSHDTEMTDEKDDIPDSDVRHVPAPHGVHREEPIASHDGEDQSEDEEAEPLAAPPPIPVSTRPVSIVVKSGERRAPPPLEIDVGDEGEVMDESDGDPIDPHFHSPQRSPGLPSISMTAAQASAPIANPPSEPPPEQPAEEAEEDAEQARRRTIAERMARLGGIKFGAPPPSRPPPPRAPTRDADDDEGASPVGPTDEPADEMKADEEEEDEQARRQRITARLANMGGMRFGMMPGAVPPPVSRPTREDSKSPPPPRRAAPPARPPPPPEPEPKESEAESETDDGVQVEAEESELEEVTHEDAEETPPPIPSRVNRPASAPHHAPTPPTTGVRPPVPTIPITASKRRSTADSSHSSREPSATAPPVPQPVILSRPSLPTPQQAEYVVVDAEEEEGESDTPVPVPPQRPNRPPPSRAAPAAPASPPPPPPEPESSDQMTSSQWELPAIPSGSLDFGGTSDLSASGLSEDSTTYPTCPPPPPPAKAEVPRPLSQVPQTKAPEDIQLSSEELMSMWGKVGIQVCEVATTLYEKSKKSLVGDGTYAGFVQAVLSEVPNASAPSPPSYGYLVYSQTGATVQKRISDIMPGDILTAHDAKLKGHKGLQTYHQNIGAEELLVGVVTEFEAKKHKVRVFQANQHVGQQTVESVSYRLEDLKSGTIKIYRVLEAS